MNSEGTIRIIQLSKLDDVYDHADAWNDLTLGGAATTPSNTYAWISTLLENCLLPNEEFHCFLAYRAAKLVGAFPVVVRPHRLLGSACPVLRTPEDPERWAFSVDCLTEPEFSTETHAALLSAVREAFPNFVSIGFKRIDCRSHTIEVIKRPQRHFKVVHELDGVGSYLTTVGSFEAYRAELGANFRGNLRKANNKLQKQDKVQFLFLGSQQVEDSHTTEFIELECSGWKGRSGTAIASSPNWQRFYRIMMSRLREAGALELHFLTAEGKAIAGHLAVRIGRKLAIIKIGYDESYAKCAPGNLLFERTVQRAFEDGGTDEIDCLTDKPWHKNWNLASREYVNVHLCNKSICALTFGYLPCKSRVLLLNPILTKLKRVPYARSFVSSLRKLYSHSVNPAHT